MYACGIMNLGVSKTKQQQGKRLYIISFCLSLFSLHPVQPFTDTVLIANTVAGTVPIVAGAVPIVAGTVSIVAGTVSIADTVLIVFVFQHFVDHVFVIVILVHLTTDDLLPHALAGPGGLWFLLQCSSLLVLYHLLLLVHTPLRLGVEVAMERLESVWGVGTSLKHRALWRWGSSLRTHFILKHTIPVLIATVSHMTFLGICLVNFSLCLTISIVHR